MIMPPPTLLAKPLGEIDEKARALLRLKFLKILSQISMYGKYHESAFIEQEIFGWATLGTNER